MEVRAIDGHVGLGGGDWGREGRGGSGRSTGHGTPRNQALGSTRQPGPSTEPGAMP